MKPLVSILIPAYNAEEWIADTIRSALAQTWPRKEIIVVDDGSTDQTVSIARQFGSKEISVIVQPNQGAAAARNKAYSVSQGDYIQWLDADDLLAPDKVAGQMDALSRSPGPRQLLSGPWGQFMYRVTKARFNLSPLWQDLSPVEWLLRKLGQNLHMQTATWLVSRELATAAGPWDTRLLSDDDGEYFCRVLLASQGTHFVPEARVFYRITTSSRLSQIGLSDRKKDAMLLSMQLHIKYIQSLENSDRVRAACLAYLNEWLLTFYPERPDLVEELEKLAHELGGSLAKPRLRWKYAWMRPVVGWSAAKRAQLLLPQYKQSAIRLWDKALSHLPGPPHNMNSPSVSILTPVYNGGRFLDECIRSVLAQDYTDWDYVVVNNCSTDNSLEIAQSYAQKDQRIRVICNKSFVPVGENHNIAFRSISPNSQYCKVVSADDVLHPDCIRKMVEFARSHPSVGIVGSYQKSDTSVKWRGLPPTTSVLPGRDMCRLDLLQDVHVFGNPTSVLYRSDLLRMTDAFFPHAQAHADTSACFRSLQHCDWGFVHEVLSVEGVHSGRVTARVDKLSGGTIAQIETLLDYGPIYLTEEELAGQKTALLERYHRFLGGCCLKLKGREFWKYQSSRMRELDIRINWSKVAAAAIAEMLVESKHPGVAFGKLKMALKEMGK